MLKYDDCGLRNIWLSNGFQYINVEGVGKCLEIKNLPALHSAIAHNQVRYKKRLSGAEIRFLRVEMGLSQKSLGDLVGVDEQTVSLWERIARKPALSAERVLRLLYLEHADGKTKVADIVKKLSDTDRQADDANKHVYEATRTGWKAAA